MLRIRLQRTGRKHEPTFRLVLTDSKNSAKSGKLLEVLGNHDFRKENTTAITKERVLHWIKMGAKPTDTVYNLLISKKIIEGKKINVLPKKSPIKKAEENKPEQSTPEKAPEVKEPASAPVAEEKPTETQSA